MAAPAVGGKADTGLGESDDEDDDEEHDMGHSGGFMSWRLRQKAVTCSVLWTDRFKRNGKCHNPHFNFFKELKKVTLYQRWLLLLCLTS